MSEKSFFFKIEGKIYGSSESDVTDRLYELLRNKAERYKITVDEENE